MHEKKPLYRRVNSRAVGARHGHGGEYRWSRNTKQAKRDDRSRGSMHPGLKHGLDYTPLFRFLLSKVGSDWSEVRREAIARLDRPDPIFWLVALDEEDGQPFVRVGESSYYSGLYVDAENRLQLVDPELSVEDMEPSCPCCTHTFNGEPFVKRFQGMQ